MKQLLALTPVVPLRLDPFRFLINVLYLYLIPLCVVHIPPVSSSYVWSFCWYLKGWNCGVNSLRNIFPFPSLYGTTAPFGPWPPSEDASILPCLLLVSSILLFLGSVLYPSGRCPPIVFLVFSLALCYEISHWEPLFRILSSPILVIRPVHPSLLILISSTILYLFWVTRQCNIVGMTQQQFHRGRNRRWHRPRY